MASKNFAKRMYLPRVVGSGVGFWAIAAVLYAHPTPTWLWGLLIFHGYVWPHIAFLMSRRARIPYLIERRIMLVESAFGGLWVVAMNFNLLPTTLLVSMLFLNSVAVGGPRFLWFCLLLLCTAVVVSGVFIHPAFIPATTPLQVYACLPMLALYPLAVGSAAYRLGAKLAAHKRELRDSSRTDRLTGLLNQGAWRSSLDEEYALTKRGTGRSALALIDIDHFKSINDEYGHLIGDEIIKLFGQVLSQVKRSTDIAGRIGGDEFGLILRGSHSEQIMLALGRLQHELRQTFLKRLDLPRVSLSIGFAEFVPAYSSVEDWLRAADQALYKAKRQGRDQIATAGN